MLRGGAEVAVNHYNMLGMADYAISMYRHEHHNGAPYTVTIFKVPDEKVPAVWRKLGRDPLTCPVQMKD